MTNAPLDRLRTDLGALTAAWVDALSSAGREAERANEGGRATEGERAFAEQFGAEQFGHEQFGHEQFGAERSFEDLSGPGLVRVVEEAARLKRAVEVFLARAGDEVARRSAPEFGAEGLAKQHGHSSPVRLVAAATGGAAAEASRLLAVGEAVRERVSFSGEVGPAKFEHVRAGLDAGTVSVEAAGLITGMLRRVELRAGPDQLGPHEQRLVEIAAGQPLALVSRAVKLAEARLDSEAVAPADEQLFQGRSLTVREDRDGVFHLRARLDPATAAPIKAALDALVGDALRRGDPAAGDPAAGVPVAGVPVAGVTGDGRGGFGSSASVVSGGVGPRGAQARPAGAGGGSAGAGGPSAGDVPGAVIEDRRSIPQLQADALAELARHALGCEAAPGTLPKTTVVVRMSLDALREGVGLAEIDGVDRPIAAATARRLAADAELIPAVLGGPSLPLDLGRATRLFSRAQRLALMERDGGCASCGANVTYAEAHHIDWWGRDSGATDLANGVMLCSHCHHQVHDHGWQIRVAEGCVWFIPPPHVDPDGAPRLGGRARFDPAPEMHAAAGARDGRRGSP